MSNYTSTPAATHLDYLDHFAGIDEIPEADSPRDSTLRTIDLDGGTATVEHLEGRVEITVQLGQRLAAALVLSSDEAEEIGRALSPLTVGDYWNLCDRLGTGGKR